MGRRLPHFARPIFGKAAQSVPRVKVVIACLAVGLLAVAVMLVSRLERTDGSLKRVREAGVLRVGYAEEAPYAFLTPGGEVSGQSPELARRVAARLGMHKIEWRLLEFGALIDELRHGRIDVAAAGMFITPERAELIGFSDPIFHVQPGLLVARGNPRGLHSFADLLADDGARVAVLSGAVESQALRRAGLAPKRLLEVPDAETGRVAVETGLADALALSAPTINWMVLQSSPARTEAAHPFAAPGPAFAQCSGVGAFAFRKEDKALREAWNREQRAAMAAPEYAVLMERFGFGAQEPPASPDAKGALPK